MRRKAIKLRQFPLQGAKVNSTHVGSLGNFFVIGDSHNNIRLYTFEKEEEVQIYSSPTNNNVQAEVTAVAMNGLEKEIYSGTNRGIINVWDMESGKSSSSLRGHSTAVNCFGIDPDDPQMLASGSYDTTIKIWDIRQKNSIGNLKSHTKPINSIAISPDGSILLSGSQDNTAKIWDFRSTQKPLFSYNQHNGPIIKVKFNPEDCMFASCSMDKTAKYFRCEQKLYGFASSTEMIATPITGIGFSQDGKILYTAANDVLKSWNMNKNGLLVETFEANWKGVQQIAMIEDALMAITFSNGNLSLWVCDVLKKIKNTSQVSAGQSLVLPKIGKYSKEDKKFQLEEMQNLVGAVNDKISGLNIEKNQQEIERKKQQRRLEEEKKRQQKQLARQRQKQRLQQEREARQRQEKQRRQKQRQAKLEQQQEAKERLLRERLERQKQLKRKLQETFEQNLKKDQYESSLEHDVLQNSSVMNISAFMVDGAQKDKLKQVELIGDIMRDSSRYDSILKERALIVKPIINFWKNGRINNALDVLESSKDKNLPAFTDCINTVIQTPLFKTAITPEVAIRLLQLIYHLMLNKHSTYVKIAMVNINLIALKFKDELIKIKSFNPISKVDITREERLAKYDKLIDEFLNIFKLERLKKLAENKGGEKDEIYRIANELYKNLQQILIKLMPKKQPELA